MSLTQNSMDSDDSYETTSEVFREMETEQFSSSSQDSTNEDGGGGEIRELYASTFSGPQVDAVNQENPMLLLTEKIKEQSLQITSLKEERIGFLEQITQLCGALESKESELVEFMQLYEQKANDVAQYMQEVQDLLGQLTGLFSDQLHESSTNEKHKIQNGDLPSQQLCKPEALENQTNDHLLAEKTNGTTWDQRSRALLHALSESVATVTARNKQGTLPRQTTTEQSNISSEGIRKPIEVPGTFKLTKLNSALIPTTNAFEYPTSDKHSNPLDAAVCQLPPLCWSPEQVIYWLNEYACLPGGCIEVAKRLRLDGKQLTTIPNNKLDKMLHLSDPGLQRKLQLALEDLRVHGSPGVSHCPGPSHLKPHWVCAIWLRRYLGLAQLSPAFAVRRVDGRMLASLAIYKPSKHGNFNVVTSPTVIENGTAAQTSPSGVGITNGLAQDSNIPMKHENGEWRGVSRKELCRILLGISRDSSGNNSNLSGAELPPATRLLLGKREACSLRTGIELLRRFNFNIELLEKAQKECQEVNENLLVWTNERVAKWLQELGLQAFTHGIEGTGLHGAYMVLDPQFDTNRLIKYLHLPSDVATFYQLDSHLQALLKPARLREGNSAAKQCSFFRRRSLSRSGRVYLTRAAAPTTTPRRDAATEKYVRKVPKPDGPSASFISCSSPRATANGTASSVTDAKMLKEEKPGVTPLPFRRTTTLLESGNCEKGYLKDTLKKQTANKKCRPAADCKEQNSNRLVRVFSRNRVTLDSQNDHTNASNCQAAIPSFTTDKESGTNGNRSGTLVRKTSMSATSIQTVSRSPLSKRLIFKKSSSPTTLDTKQITHDREGVEASDAPLIDPLSPDGWRGRIRIKLNQSTRSFQFNRVMESGSSNPHESCSQTQTVSTGMPLPPSPSCKSWQGQNVSDSFCPPQNSSDTTSHKHNPSECDSQKSLTLSSMSLLSHVYTTSQDFEPS